MDTKLNAIERATLCQYQKLKPDYTQNYKDVTTIRTFLMGYPMLISNFNSADFNKYINIKGQLLKFLVHSKNKNILTQPVILLISYALHKYCNTTIEHWPLSYENLRVSLEGLGYSSDLLYDA